MRVISETNYHPVLLRLLGSHQLIQLETKTIDCFQSHNYQFDIGYSVQKSILTHSSSSSPWFILMASIEVPSNRSSIILGDKDMSSSARRAIYLPSLPITWKNVCYGILFFFVMKTRIPVFLAMCQHNEEFMITECPYNRWPQRASGKISY